MQSIKRENPTGLVKKASTTIEHEGCEYILEATHSMQKDGLVSSFSCRKDGVEVEVPEDLVELATDVQFWSKMEDDEIQDAKRIFQAQTMENSQRETMLTLGKNLRETTLLPFCKEKGLLFLQGYNSLYFEEAYSDNPKFFYQDTENGLKILPRRTPEKENLPKDINDMLTLLNTEAVENIPLGFFIEPVTLEDIGQITYTVHPWGPSPDFNLSN